jgi:hypothetical protein
MPVVEKTLAELVEAVLAEVAPEELADLPLALRAHDASRRPHIRAQTGVNEEAATGPLAAGEILSGIVIAVGADLATEVILVGLRSAGRKGLALVRRRRQRVRSTDPLPALKFEDAAAFRTRAAELSKEYGAPTDTAEKIADSIVNRWPSTSD